MTTENRNNKNKKRNISGIIIVAIVIALCLCVVVGVLSSVDDESPEISEVVTSAPAEDKAPTNTLVPSKTKPPPSPAGPTDTLAPTNTPFPTNTPAPTNTPTPPPEPVFFDGTGDAVIDIDLEPMSGYAVAHIVGNSTSRHMAVQSFDANGNPVDLLVNTTDPYDGFRPVDFYERETTVRLQVTATGPWQITLYPITPEHNRVIDVPGTYSGVGDDVTFLEGGIPDMANIKGNQSSRHFAVISYNGGGDLLVNTTDPYEGSVILHKDTIVLEIVSAGGWSIEIISK
jgi:hypothetical protein